MIVLTLCPRRKLTMNPNHEKNLTEFEQYLHHEEKSQATIEKYMRDVRAFLNYMTGGEIGKDQMIAFKEYLAARYAPASVNSMLVSVNSFLRYTGQAHCCVKLLKIQRQRLFGQQILQGKCNGFLGCGLTHCSYFLHRSCCMNTI